MPPYSVETMSRRELRKCYNRYAWAVLLLFPLSQWTAQGLLLAADRLMPPMPLNSVAWSISTQSVVNAVASYVPTLLVFLLLLRRFPRAEKLQVQRMSLWELAQALVFTMGVCFLFNLLTLGAVNLMERYVGLNAVNRVTVRDNVTSIWDQLLFSVLVPPVCEELLFRRLLLDRLRPLGDASAVYLSALAFAMFHMNFFQMLYAFTLGAFFAVVVLLTGSIRDTILLHMSVNGLNVLNNALKNPTYTLIYTICLSVCIPLALLLFLQKRKHIHMEPGPLRLSARDKRRSCLGSAWFWLMLLGCSALSVIVIF